jgi:3-carboxy-cis,cis-muconate cycloisomerase
MRQNAYTTGEQMTSERVAAVLAPHLGRARAKELLSEATAEAERSGVPLAAVLGRSPDVAARLSAGELRHLLDPAHYTGAAGSLVDRALKR